MTRHKQTNGFTLVLVLIMSLALMVLSLALLQSVDFLRTDNMAKYYTKLAEDAAEAGTAYAKACAVANGHQQSWSGTLTPDKNCQGSAGGTSAYVLNNASVQTTFSVGDLTAVDNGVIISATGTTQVKVNGTGTVVKTYTQIIKRKVIWDPNLVSEQSSSGTTRTCGILGGNVYCWGTNYYGQLGNGKAGEIDCPNPPNPTGNCDDSSVPVRLYRDPAVLGNKKITSIASGSFFNCVIASDNQVYCWGKNDAYQLGNTSGDSAVPVLVPGLSGKTVVKLGVASRTACALINNGDVYCWGTNLQGQLGAGLAANKVATPTLMAGPSLSSGPLAGKVITALSNSGTFNDTLCAIDNTYKAYCWGANSQGEVGIGVTGGTYNTPQAVTGGALSGKKVIAIQGDGNDSNNDAGKKGNDSSIGDAHTCAVAYTSTPSDAKAYCWGSNSKGNLGNNGTIGKAGNTFPAWIYNTPQAVSTSGVLSGLTVTSVAAGDAGSCVTAYPTSGSTDNQRAYCWGPPYALGNGNTTKSAIPVQVDDGNGIFTGNKVDNLIGGAERFCARVKQTAYCWGANGVGQIGTGSNTPTTVLIPTEAIFLRPVSNDYIF